MNFKALIVSVIAIIIAASCNLNNQKPEKPTEIFDWKTVSVWDLKVKGSVSTSFPDMASTVKIFTSPDMKNTSLIAQGAMFSGESFDASLSLPLSVNNVYVSVSSPEGRISIYEVSVNKTNKDLLLDLSTAEKYTIETKTTTVYEVPKVDIPATFDYIIDEDHPFPDKLEDGKTYLIPTGSTVTMTNPASTLNSLWNYNNKLHRIYVAGTLNIPEWLDIENHQKISGVCFFVLDGGTLNSGLMKFREFGNSYDVHPAIYIAPTGVMNVTKLVPFQSKTIIVEGYLNCDYYHSAYYTNLHVSGRMVVTEFMQLQWRPNAEEAKEMSCSDVYVYSGGLIDARKVAELGTVTIHMYKDAIFRMYHSGSYYTDFVTPEGQETSLLITDDYGMGQNYISLDGGIEFYVKNTNNGESRLNALVDGKDAIWVDGYDNRVYHIDENEYNLGYGVIDRLIDNDGDGVPSDKDIDDNDPDVAYKSYYPSSEDYATVMFEDLWPYPGDYDMNDLVSDFRIEWTSNSDNKVVYMDFIWKLRAAGTMQNMALAFQLDDIYPSEISKVTRTHDIAGNAPFELTNGLEGGQSKAVVPVFNRVGDVSTSDSYLLNTSDNQSYIPIPYNRIRLEFATPQNISKLNIDKFNIFIVTSKDYSLPRGIEIHLPGYNQTDKGKVLTDHESLNDQDNYISKSGMMWALMVPKSISYPKEYKSISDTYIHFKAWYESFGESHSDWYENKSGYINTTNIYNEPVVEDETKE